MLKVKLLDANAIAPTVANPGEDLGYDLYALEDAALVPGVTTTVRTGIAAEFEVSIPVPSAIKGYTNMMRMPYGLLYRDRSSMAKKGITVSGGVIDAGYRGELVVMLTLRIVDALRTVGDKLTFDVTEAYTIKAGDKIAQMIPLPVLTQIGVQVVDELSGSVRGFTGIFADLFTTNFRR